MIFHETGIAIIMGALVAWMLLAVSSRFLRNFSQIDGYKYEFSHQTFFFYILPPLVFAAGYTLKRKFFVKNIVIIMSLGIIGTIIACLVLIFGIGMLGSTLKDYEIVLLVSFEFGLMGI